MPIACQAMGIASLCGLICAVWVTTGSQGANWNPSNDVVTCLRVQSVEIR
jgi:hypothetical protein